MPPQGRKIRRTIHSTVPGAVNKVVLWIWEHHLERQAWECFLPCTPVVPLPELKKVGGTTTSTSTNSRDKRVVPWSKKHRGSHNFKWVDECPCTVSKQPKPTPKFKTPLGSNIAARRVWRRKPVQNHVEGRMVQCGRTVREALVPLHPAHPLHRQRQLHKYGSRQQGAT